VETFPVRQADGSKIKRTTGSKLQQIRREHFSRHPLCVLCLKKTPPVIREAVVLDHIIALVNGGTDTHGNRQGLCGECHDDKTRQDLKQRVKPRIGVDGWPIKM
jgi:5-methylcytosine-specific restriction endonuclease McrA